MSNSAAPRDVDADTARRPDIIGRAAGGGGLAAGRRVVVVDAGSRGTLPLAPSTGDSGHAA